MQYEKPFSEQDSLQLIDSMINKARNQFHENGHLYLLWGWVVLICSVTQFVLIELQVRHHYLIWMLTWIAVIYQIIYLIRKSKQRRVRTYTDNILGSVWLSFVVSMFLVALITGQISGNGMHSVFNLLVLALYGIPTLISGTILRFNPLKIGALCCWGFAVLASFIPERYHLLLLGAAVIAAWIIPGYLLRKNFSN